MFLLVMTTYTYILLLVSNNRPLFAEIRVLVHGRNSTLTASQDTSNGNNNSTNRTEEFRGILYSQPVWRTSAGSKIRSPELQSNNNNNNNGTHHYYTIPNNSSSQLTTSIGDNNVNASSRLGKGVRIALVEPTFTMEYTITPSMSFTKNIIMFQLLRILQAI